MIEPLKDSERALVALAMNIPQDSVTQYRTSNQESQDVDP